jgi:hypothetical protein
MLSWLTMTSFTAHLGRSLLCAACLMPALASTGAQATPRASLASAGPATATRPPHLSALSAPAAELVRWVRRTDNHAGRPYVVVDKQQARVWVFDAQHQPVASSAALLGQARGDHEVPDIATRDVTQLALEARITPAGRFDTEPGVNLQGEPVVWLNHDAGLAMHRVRPGLAQAGRLQRLAAGVASAQRVSMGCVVLPVAFYDAVIQPLLGQQTGVVYVLPEHSSVQSWLSRWGQAGRLVSASADPA